MLDGLPSHLQDYSYDEPRPSLRVLGEGPMDYESFRQLTVQRVRLLTGNDFARDAKTGSAGLLAWYDYRTLHVSSNLPKRIELVALDVQINKDFFQGDQDRFLGYCIEHELFEVYIRALGNLSEEAAHLLARVRQYTSAIVKHEDGDLLGFYEGLVSGIGHLDETHYVARWQARAMQSPLIDPSE
ncbi:MAG: hypothetical protein QF442_03250 [Candidatus Peribacteraceae bacterium]|nr:hypothetical protein [Candidatus Peribacteraceae bacterium]